MGMPNSFSITSSCLTIAKQDDKPPILVYWAVSVVVIQYTITRVAESWDPGIQDPTFFLPEICSFCISDHNNKPSSAVHWNGFGWHWGIGKFPYVWAILLKMQLEHVAIRYFLVTSFFTQCNTHFLEKSNICLLYKVVQ